MLHSTTNSRNPMCGVRGIRYVVRKKRSTGGRRVEEGVLGEVGYAGLKVCHQVYHCLEMDSMAAIHGDDNIAEGEPEKMDRLDEILRQLVVVTSARQQQAGSIRARTVLEGSNGGQQKARSRVDGIYRTACCNRR